MKKLIIAALIFTTIAYTACNSSNTHSHEGQTPDTTATISTPSTDHAVTEVKPQFTNVDPQVASALKLVIDQYLHIKNGLAGDNANDAANGGKSMAEALKKLDKNALTPEQQKLYVENEDDLKEHAEHIGKNEGNIEHQREHFAQMSEDIYSLVKAFGGGQPLYQDHCPMYDNNKGALWLSEVKEIKNPYFGGKMSNCGSLNEIIK
ncbi:DUF3347 domain-containing protein [Chitinophaga silvatica]|uniref:DUF3347 domain-containing protein n=1 Tax=Chitinophaga silvatica TaxID=2282649 RepID=A0A3E1Y443_9BACT|nr:DUF3347 domain-containing protein [Chitinophaga silvatica]RFS19454.1 DUF3347 domain-containing protein [Chitinophaga silvatica]